mgnify:CR=1 FL=1
MTRLKLYRCDRCGKTFEIREDEEPLTIRIIDDGEESIIHLCLDCKVVFDLFMRYQESFDNLADKIIDEEEKNG